MQKHLVVVVVGVLAATNLFAAPVTVQSPDGQVAASFEVENGELFYSVSKSGKPVVGSSKVEIFAGAKMAVVGQSIRDNDSSWTPVYGQFSTIRDHHRELTLSLTAGGTPVNLLCRVVDTGIGFRFVLPEGSLAAKSCRFPRATTCSTTRRPIRGSAAQKWNLWRKQQGSPYPW